MKLLIADSSHIFSHTLYQYLTSHFQLHTCADGEQVLRLLPQLQPEIMIINLMLPHTDGLCVLQQMTYRPRIIMALTTYVSPYIEHLLLELGVDYILIAPSTATLIGRLEDLVRRQIIVRDPTDTKSLARAYLQALNVPTHLDGYRQLCVAIPLYAENPAQLFTKELYPTIARVCRYKDSRAVEHAMRTAIQIAWTHRNDNIWSKYFPPGADGSIPCPSNKTFISNLAELARR